MFWISLWLGFVWNFSCCDKGEDKPSEAEPAGSAKGAEVMCLLGPFVSAGQRCPCWGRTWEHSQTFLSAYQGEPAQGQRPCHWHVISLGERDLFGYLVWEQKVRCRTKQKPKKAWDAEACALLGLWQSLPLSRGVSISKNNGLGSLQPVRNTSSVLNYSAFKLGRK